MQTLFQDLRHAVRSLGKSPGFAIVATATLAIGIGANTAIFSIIETVLLRLLPYRNPEQLLRLYETESAPGQYPFAGPDFINWKTQNSTFQDMTLFGWQADRNLSGRGEPDHVVTLSAEANFFSLLGVTPLLGRTFAPGEDQPGKDEVAVLSYGLWQSHFAGDPKIVGQTLSLDSKKYTVIGVMPETFRYPTRVQLWIPLDMDSKTLGLRGNHSTQAIGRLKPGVTIQKAQADLTLIASRLEQQYPDSNYKVGTYVVSLHEDMAGRSGQQIGGVTQIEQSILRPQVALLYFRVQIHNRPLDAHRGSENSDQAVVILAGDRVELMVMAAGAAHGQRQQATRNGVHPLVPVVGHESADHVRGQALILVIDRRCAQVAESSQVLTRCAGHQVSGELELHETVVGKILIEGADHIVPVGVGPWEIGSLEEDIAFVM